MPDDIAPEKLSAYLGTHFRYSALGQEITLRIGQHSPETQLLARKLGHDCAVFITAYNPMGTVCPAAENIAANRRLADRLFGMTPHVFDGAGHDPSGNWEAELSFMAFGVGRALAITLGTEFSQDAVVWVGADAIPELLVTR